VALATLGKLSPKEQSSILERVGFRSTAVNEVMQLDDEAAKLGKLLMGRKTAQPAAAFSVLEKARTDLLVYLLADTSKPQIANKIRNYLRRWRPLKLGLPGVSLELEALGMTRGPKFDKVMDSFFLAQLAGKARTPEDRVKLLRKLAGIKEPPKVKPKEEKKRPGDKSQKTAAGKKPAEPEKVLSAAAGAKSQVAQRGTQTSEKTPPLRKAAPAAARAKASGARRR
jgi:hypothetical protein